MNLLMFVKGEEKEKKKKRKFKKGIKIDKLCNRLCNWIRNPSQDINNNEIKISCTLKTCNELNNDVTLSGLVP